MSHSEHDVKLVMWPFWTKRRFELNLVIHEVSYSVSSLRGSRGAPGYAVPGTANSTVDQLSSSLQVKQKSGRDVKIKFKPKVVKKKCKLKMALTLRDFLLRATLAGTAGTEPILLRCTNSTGTDSERKLKGRKTHTKINDKLGEQGNLKLNLTCNVI